MKPKSLLCAPLFLVAVLAVLSSVSAQTLPDYQLLTTIQIPSNLQSSDIAWVDPGTQRYYLADRGNGKGQGRVDVIDTAQDVYLYSIPTYFAEVGFAGIVTGAPCNQSGPNGVVAIPQLNQLYVPDGDSTVKVVDLGAKAVVATISTGGKCRADELAYDPLDHIIMVTNPSDSPPFISFISADSQAVLGTYTYPKAQAGLEQPVWNPQTYRFLISVPAIAPSTQGSVDEFDPLTMTMTNSYKIGCSPAGLALGPLQRTMTSCGNVIDGRNGSLLANPATSGDEIWFNPGDNRYYFGLMVVDAETNQLLGNLLATGGRNPAVDPNNNHIFVQVGGVGVEVFAPVRK